MTRRPIGLAGARANCRCGPRAERRPGRSPSLSAGCSSGRGCDAMPLETIPFGGLRALEADELVGLDVALDATNCVVDDGTLRGRNGYRSISGGDIGSGAVQGLWRFRPSAASARSVAVQGGHVWTVTDPSSETATDGA